MHLTYISFCWHHERVWVYHREDTLPQDRSGGRLWKTIRFTKHAHSFHEAVEAANPEVQPLPTTVYIDG